MALNTVVTVLGADRTGIIAGVCTTLAANNANIYDIRQTVIDDIFSMTMKVALDEETADFNTVLHSSQLLPSLWLRAGNRPSPRQTRSKGST